jgi:hypothetical protein
MAVYMLCFDKMRDIGASPLQSSRGHVVRKQCAWYQVVVDTILADDEWESSGTKQSLHTTCG